MRTCDASPRSVIHNKTVRPRAGAKVNVVSRTIPFRTACALPHRSMLSGAPSASCKTDDVLRYAYTGVSGNCPGPTDGPRGNVRDSDVTLPNWLVHFQESVTG